MKLLRLAIIIGFCSLTGRAQTATELNAKYGAAHDSYEVRPGIFMTVNFAADGRVCHASIEKRHVRASGTIDLDSTFMSPELTKLIVDELVPNNQRGNVSKASGDSFFVGGGVTTSDNYDNVMITYYGNAVDRGAAAVVIQWKNRGCP